MWREFYNCTHVSNRFPQKWPRPRSSSSLDSFSDLFLIYRRVSTVGNANRTSRHNRHVRVLAEDLEPTARNSVIEPKTHLSEHCILNIRATGRGGCDNIIYIATFHTFLSYSSCQKLYQTALRYCAWLIAPR